MQKLESCSFCLGEQPYQCNDRYCGYQSKPIRSSQPRVPINHQQTPNVSRENSPSLGTDDQSSYQPPIPKPDGSEQARSSQALNYADVGSSQEEVDDVIKRLMKNARNGSVPCDCGLWFKTIRERKERKKTEENSNNNLRSHLIRRGCEKHPSFKKQPLPK